MQDLREDISQLKTVGHYAKITGNNRQTVY